jgi:hypothetical protein
MRVSAWRVAPIALIGVAAMCAVLSAGHGRRLEQLAWVPETGRSPVWVFGSAKTALRHAAAHDGHGSNPSALDVLHKAGSLAARLEQELQAVPSTSTTAAGPGTGCALLSCLVKTDAHTDRCTDAGVS